MISNLSFLSTKGIHIVDEKGKPLLLRGFGLGGWLLPEGYMWRLYDACDRPRHMEKLIDTLCGCSYGTYFWDRYYQHYYGKKEIELIAKHGFNSVRIPFNSRHLYTVHGKEDVVLVQERIAHLDRMISWCKEYNLYVILDMHGAPGGQTGANIDDSECDQPLLFTSIAYQDECVALWKLLAQRYRDEPTVAAYDLLNEPLPSWFNSYNHLVLPLYRRIRDAIRSVDNRHIIMIEGVHWATDWSIFDQLETEQFDDNYLLQFHKYWNNPDTLSMKTFLGYREKLNVPLYMGEGGENTLLWYTALFPLLESLSISWNFWTCKKMDCTNSLFSFPVPHRWEELLSYLTDHRPLTKIDAQYIFDQLLHVITHQSHLQEPLVRALKREIPISIPAEFFSSALAKTKRIPGAHFRLDEEISILFRDGHTGPVLYEQRNGEDQGRDQQLCVLLHGGESVQYVAHTHSDDTIHIKLDYRVEEDPVTIEITLDGNTYRYSPEIGCFCVVLAGRHDIGIFVIEGVMQLETIHLSLQEH